MVTYILTNTETILEVDVRPQESHVGDSAVKGLLNLELKQKISSSAFDEQQGYLSAAATAAYVSLNKLDQRQRYRASVTLHSINGSDFNFVQGSTSSGLGYAIALFDAWWRLLLEKPIHCTGPVFATGEILASGRIKAINHLADKIDSTCGCVEASKGDISRFYFVYPEENDSEVSKEQRNRLEKLGCILLPANQLQKVLGVLLGDAYDGDALGRWRPFKGLSSFDYEDSVRFFGRNRDIERLYEDLTKNDGLLIVSGASGTGKSSLIKAGLIPRLENEIEEFYWASTTPLSLPMGNGVVEFIVDQFNIVWRLEEKGLSSQLLLSTLLQSLDDGLALIAPYIVDETKCCLLYFDQYEEVFNQEAQEDTAIAQNLKLIDTLARKIEPLNIVLALRNEYLSLLLDSNAIQSPIVSNVASQLSSDDWYQIVHKQALFSGIEFEQLGNGDALDRIIIEEALNTPFALPMVEFLLEQLYFSASSNGYNGTLLLLKDYEKLGGLAGAIASRASELTNTSKYRSSVGELFEAFVGLNGESLPYAKLVDFKKYQLDNPNLYRLILEFIDANLIVSVAYNDKNDVVKFAHDRLFLNWIELKNWVQNTHSYLAWRYRVDASFSQWDRSGSVKSNGYLLRDRELLKTALRFKSEGFMKDRRLTQYIVASQKKRSKRVGAVIAIWLLLPTITLSIYYLTELRVEKRYYSATGERWGVPFGIGELTDEQVKHRTYSYLLEYKGGLLRKKVHQNGFGTAFPEEMNDVAISEYNYTEEGTLLSILEKNELNRFLRKKRYSFDGASAIVNLMNEQGSLSFRTVVKPVDYRGYLTDPDDRLRSTNLDVTQYYIEYTNDGFKAKERYQNPYGIDVPLHYTLYATEYTYYPSGRLLSKTFLGQDGARYITANENYSTVFYYDDSGFLEKEMLVGEGRDELKRYYNDEWGNAVKSVFFDSDNQIQINRPRPIETREVDENGSVVNISGFDANNNLIEKGYGVAVYERGYDSQGRLTSEIYYDKDRKRTTAKGNCSKTEREFTAKGYIKSESCFDSFDRPLLTDAGGCAKTRFSYDENQNRSGQKCFGVDGNLAKDIEGVAEYITQHNMTGAVTKLSMFDEAGNPAVNQEGFSSVTFGYDKPGNLLEEAYFDADGQPASLAPYGDDPAQIEDVVRILWKHDKNGNVTENQYMGADGAPSSIDGISKSIFGYDTLGRLIELSYYDVNDSPTLFSESFFKHVTVYADSGNVIISELYYDQYGDEVSLFKVSEIGEDSGYFEVEPATDSPLRITSVQAGAEVYIDGKLIGSAPYSGVVKSGFHNLTISKDGYASISEFIDADRSSGFFANYELEPLEKTDDLKVLAANGDSVAQKNLGNQYLNGENISQDYALAMDWYERSALNNYPQAMHNIGWLYSQGFGVEKNLFQARKWYERAAKLGFPLSQVVLGHMLASGDGGEPDMNSAVNYWHLAAEAGHGGAQLMLGKTYMRGWTGDRDIEKAIGWYKKAAYQGVPYAGFMLFNYYRAGDLKDIDSVEAVKWLEFAARSELTEAYFELAVTYYFSDILDRDGANALYWLKKASKFESSLYDLVGNTYYSGDVGIPIDYLKAFKWYLKAVKEQEKEKEKEQTSDSSAWYLAQLYLHGKGTDQNIDIARKLMLITSNSNSIFSNHAKIWLEKSGAL